MDNFNIIISGVGGQGVITLISIINQAGFIEGHNVRSSELHGLSQRGGAVLAHIRMGEKVFSPLVQKGGADLILGLEATETLREICFFGKQTKILADRMTMPYLNGPEKESVFKSLEDIAKNNLFLENASEICKEKLGKDFLAGVYLLGKAVSKNLIPLKKDSVLQAIKEVVGEKYFEVNKTAFNLAF